MVDFVTREATSVYNFFAVYCNRKGTFTITYPPKENREILNRIIDFGPACCKGQCIEEFYVLLFTDALGRHEYVHCLQSSADNLFCFSSYLPWFEFFRYFLQEIRQKELFKREWTPALKKFLESLQAISIPTACQSFLSTPVPSGIPKPNIHTSIPSLDMPYYTKSLDEYFSALSYPSWIDIFVSFLLEKSVLFLSKSREKLTYCIIAAISLLYPLTWVFPIYLTLTRRLLEMLQSPVPFIAGIHSCLFAEAKQYISAGTRIVDLDEKKIKINLPNEELDGESIPSPIFQFLVDDLNRVKRNFTPAIHSKNGEYLLLKFSDFERRKYLLQQAKPFYTLLVNLFGFFRQCVNERGTVDSRLLIRCQQCPAMTPFLTDLFDSQMANYFLEGRISRRISDSFEIDCLQLTKECLANCLPNQQDKVNFGDLNWIASKRILSDTVSKKYSRFRQNIEKRILKFTSRRKVSNSYNISVDLDSIRLSYPWNSSKSAIGNTVNTNAADNEQIESNGELYPDLNLVDSKLSAIPTASISSFRSLPTPVISSRSYSDLTDATLLEAWLPTIERVRPPVPPRPATPYGLSLVGCQSKNTSASVDNKEEIIKKLPKKDGYSDRMPEIAPISDESSYTR